MAKNPTSCDCNIIHEDIVNEIRGKMPIEADFAKAADLFKLFADTSRMKILWILSQKEVCVCDLAALLDTSKSAVSHKLNALRLENLVDYRKEGRIAFYFLADTQAKKLLKNGFDFAQR